MSLVLTSRTNRDDNHEILELVGRGAMGEVYKARQIEVDQIVAVNSCNSN